MRMYVCECVPIDPRRRLLAVLPDEECGFVSPSITKLTVCLQTKLVEENECPSTRHRDLEERRLRLLAGTHTTGIGFPYNPLSLPLLSLPLSSRRCSVLVPRPQKKNRNAPISRVIICDVPRLWLCQKIVPSVCVRASLCGFRREHETDRPTCLLKPTRFLVTCSVWSRRTLRHVSAFRFPRK